MMRLARWLIQNGCLIVLAVLFFVGGLFGVLTFLFGWEGALAAFGMVTFVGYSWLMFFLGGRYKTMAIREAIALGKTVNEGADAVARSSEMALKTLMRQAQVEQSWQRYEQQRGRVEDNGYPALGSGVSGFTIVDHREE